MLIHALQYKINTVPTGEEKEGKKQEEEEAIEGEEREEEKATCITAILSTSHLTCTPYHEFRRALPQLQHLQYKHADINV